jgi:hypothetical protein
MPDTRALEIVKASLIEQWNGSGAGPGAADALAATQAFAATFEGISIKRSRGGLAIGHSYSTPTAPPRLEFRVTAASGPNYAQARQLEQDARAQGYETNLKAYPRPVVALANNAAGLAFAPVIGGRRRPLHIGASVAHESGDAGTLAAFLKLEDGGTGIISCVHVLAWANWNKVNVGDPIQQPGAPDPIPQSNRIGALTDQFAPFVSASVKNLDAAVARLAEKTVHSGNTIPDLDCVPKRLRGKPIGTPLSAGALPEGTRVCKIGRTTGYTEASVSAQNFQNLQVGFDPDSTKHVFTFSGVHEMLWDRDGDSFTGPGDSGALVMTVDDLCPVGLHFCAIPGAGGIGVSYAVPWHRIVETFGVTLLAGN